MATPKEQHDARPHARTTGTRHERDAPADAVIGAPPGAGAPTPASAPTPRVPAGRPLTDSAAGPLPDR